MLRLSCAFCAHRNPEGSSFCNQCGSPLNLAPCRACEAINNQDDERCYACGAALEPAPDRSSEVDTVSRTLVQQPAEATRDSTAAALAALAPLPPAPGDAEPPVVQHFDIEHWNPRHDEPESAEADTFPDEAREEPVRYPPGAQYEARRTRWPQRLLLAVAFAAIVGAIYWSTLQPRPDAVSTPAADAPMTSGPAPAVAPLPDASPGSAAPAMAPVPTAPAAAQPPASAATAQPGAPQSAPATASESPPPRETAQSAPSAAPADDPSPVVRNDDASTGGRPAASEARVRAPAGNRSREQAMRDALATRRLIERDLGVAAARDSRTTR